MPVCMDMFADVPYLNSTHFLAVAVQKSV